MSRIAALAFVAFAILAACSSRPVVVRGVPEDSRVRLFYNLAGAVDVPADHVYQTQHGLIAVEDLPPDATRATSIPLLSVEARRFDGCLLASVTQQSWEVRLRPVLDCGRLSEPTPAQQPLRVDPKPDPAPAVDTDGDGVLDAADLCPQEDARFRELCTVPLKTNVRGECVAVGGRVVGYSVPSPTRLGCLDGDRDADGYPDSVDDCPDVARGPYPGPGAGCPDTKCPTPAPVLLRWQPSQTFPPGTDTSAPKIVDATPTKLPAGERRTIVVRVTGVDARTLSRVDNSTPLIVEQLGGLTNAHAYLQVKAPAGAPVGALGDLLLFFGTTTLRLSGLEVVPAPTSC